MRDPSRDPLGRPSSRGSASDYQERIAKAVARYGSTVAPLLRLKVGQAEASLTFAVESLLKEAGHALGLEGLVVHREASHFDLGIRPDLAVDVAGARVGVVELKAPGMGVPGATNWGKSRDRAQWEKLRLLPNVLYTDGSSWAVYHYGEPGGDTARLDVPGHHVGDRSARRLDHVGGLRVRW
jgi:hypothetical protein